MRHLLLLIASVFVWAAPAAACSVEADYQVPTNFELVQRSKLIVVARVVSVPTNFSAAMEGGKETWVAIQPMRVLKGTAPTRPLELMGWEPPSGDHGTPTPTTLSQSHWSSGLGACIRQVYTSGELVVAMFDDGNPEIRKHTGRDLIQLFFPFARSVETVEGVDDVWVRAVERYVALQAGPADGLDERINAAIRELESIPTAEAQAIVADLRYHLTRKDPENVWSTVSLPVATMAGVRGQKGAALYCVTGTAPGVKVDGARSEVVELVADGTRLATKPAVAGPVEKKMLDSSTRTLSSGKDPPPSSLYHFSDPTALVATLRSASRKVEITADGKPLIGGRPLDALLRWASHCEKLQRLPPPTEEQLRH